MAPHFLSLCPPSMHSACTAPGSGGFQRRKREAGGWARGCLSRTITLRRNAAAGGSRWQGGAGLLVDEDEEMCATHSSSALAVNAFAPFRSHPERLTLAGLAGFTQANFENKLPTGLLGNPPNLDFVARGPVGVVAVESKFTEMLGAKKAKFASSYEGAIDRLAEPGWRDAYRSLLAGPSRFKRLDAAQLVKHYLGMRHSLGEAVGSQVLMYVFWEPTNAADIGVFGQHRHEVEEFAGELEGSEVRFHALSYASLWDEWEARCEWDGIGEHVARLRERYELAVPVPAG